MRLLSAGYCSAILYAASVVNAVKACAIAPDPGAASLKCMLSSGAEIYFPDDPQFKQETTRWSELDPPRPSFVVVAATEDDVATTVSVQAF